ncbi:MAG: helix-turn-helix transcriptional regulator [Syntrophales bacterium]
MAHHPILERYLWFDGQIRRGRCPNAVDLAKRFELCRKTAQRDIAFLRYRLDAPLEYDNARRGYKYTDDAFRLPPLFATERQLMALLMARRLLQTGGGRLDRDLETFAETLLSTVADRRLSRERLDRLFSAAWSGNSPAGEAVFRPVLFALTQERLLRILYTSPRTNERTERTVEPHHLQHYQGSWVLLAWCRQAGDWRKFFLSRMEQASLLTEGFTPRPHEAWKPHLEGAYGIFQGKKAFPVRLRFCAERARWIRLQTWHEKQRIVVLPDGCLELHLPVTDLREIRLKILQFGADVEVLEPVELRDSIRLEIEKMTALYCCNEALPPLAESCPFKAFSGAVST